MKKIHLLETKCIEYISNVNNYSLHSKDIKNIINSETTPTINHIFYGPPGIGKYSTCLSVICNFSPSLLEYEKKLINNT